MATMTVSLSEPMIGAQVRRGDYASASDYIRDLVRRDRARREQEWSLERLRQKLADARDCGESGRSVEEIFAEAQTIAKAHALVNG